MRFTGITQRIVNLATLTSKDFDKITKLLKAKEMLQARISKIDALLSAFESRKLVTLAVVAKKRTMSPAARARIAAAQKARWAKLKGKKAAKPVARKKHKMSAAGRAAIAAAARVRWAKVRAEKAKK